jgi:two-component system, OmpR family, KDP operon response regulator KdpE
MKKILVVEDDPSVGKVLHQRLTKSGFDVTAAADAYQALTSAKGVMPDLIILDLMIPCGGGEGALQNLKRSIKTSMIPVLVLTASRDPELKKRMLDAGVEGYMEKPYEPVELIATINAILQKESQG